MFCEDCKLRIDLDIREINYRRSLKEAGERKKYYHINCILWRLEKQNNVIIRSPKRKESR